MLPEHSFRQSSRQPESFPKKVPMLEKHSRTSGRRGLSIGISQKLASYHYLLIVCAVQATARTRRVRLSPCRSNERPKENFVRASGPFRGRGLYPTLKLPGSLRPRGRLSNESPATISRVASTSVMVKSQSRKREEDKPDRKRLSMILPRSGGPNRSGSLHGRCRPLVRTPR